MRLHLFQAFDSAQSAHELTLRNSELESHLKQHVGVIDTKVEQLESMENKLQRAVEEVSTLKKRIDKYKNRESAGIADEVLLEEIKTYKVRILQLVIYHHVFALDQTQLSLLWFQEEGYSVD